MTSIYILCKFVLAFSSFWVRKATAKTTPIPTNRTKNANIPLEGDKLLNSSDLPFAISLGVPLPADPIDQQELFLGVGVRVIPVIEGLLDIFNNVDF